MTPQLLFSADKIHKSSGLPIDTAALTCADLPALVLVLESVKADMDDWPQLTYYKQANAQLAPLTADESRVIFLGDSITEQWFSPKFVGLFTDKSYIGRGISAQTTPQILLRLRVDVIALKPKIMVFLAGTNDIGSNTGPISLEQTQDNIASIAELATLHNITVVLSSVLPTSNYHFDGKDPRGPQTTRRPLEKIRSLNEWLKDYCEHQGHTYVDYYSALVDENGMLKAELSDDDLHPNQAGFKIMTRLVEGAIANTRKVSAESHVPCFLVVDSQ